MRCQREQGFTLAELLVAIAVASIVLVAISAIFTRSVRVYTLENAKAALQQEVRATLEIMARDIRMAGYDPNRTGDFKIKTASTTRFHFFSDLNEDGILDPAPSFPTCEILSYRLDAANNLVQVICGEGTGVQDPQAILGGTDIDVTALDFDYRKNDGQSTTTLNLIRAVVITITAQIPAGRAGMVTRTYSTWVDIRNAGPNSGL